MSDPQLKTTPASSCRLLHISSLLFPSHIIAPFNMAKMYAIKTSPGKGRGIFATKAIASGTMIMKDRVAMKVHKMGPSIREADVMKRFDLLSKANQERFLELHEGNRQYESKIFRIWKGMYFELVASISIPI